MHLWQGILVWALSVPAALLASPQTTKPAPASPHHINHDPPIKQAINLLIEEARQAKRDQKLPSTAPDFAKRFTQKIENDDVLSALVQPAHKDSFIDAYIRWQLTSYSPVLPVLDDRQFLKLMANAPAMVANPRADDEIVKTFREAEHADHVSEPDRKRLRDGAAELDRRTHVAEALNAPALGYRDWVITQIEKWPDSSRIGRRLQWLIERCAATITGGWPSRTIKAKVSKDFKSASGNTALAAAQRSMIADQAHRLIGLKRTAIDEITFLADGSLKVTFTTPAVDEDDVNKWTALLNGEATK